MMEHVKKYPALFIGHGSPMNILADNPFTRDMIKLIEKEPLYHFELGKQLTGLRNEDILVIGSGNIVHNLSLMDFNDNAIPFDWAKEFDSAIKNSLDNKDFKSLIDYYQMGNIARKAIPFNDHYLPMLYTLGMIGEDEKINFVHESIQNGSVSMRSFITA